MKWPSFGLSYRVLFLTAFMLIFLGSAILFVALRQQKDLIFKYSISAIQEKLDPVEKKTEAIRFTVKNLTRLEQIRKYYNSISENNPDKLPHTQFVAIEKGVRSYLESRSGGSMDDRMFRLIRTYAARLNGAHMEIDLADDPEAIRGILFRFRDTGRAMDSVMRDQFGYEESLRSVFQGIDQSEYRIQTVSLFFEAHFDTSMLEPVRDLDFEIGRIQRELAKQDVQENKERTESLRSALRGIREQRYRLSRLTQNEINMLRVGSDAAIRDTLTPVRFAFYNKKPSLIPHLQELSMDDHVYLVSVRTLFMNPQITERAGVILKELDGPDEDLWFRYITREKHTNMDLSSIIDQLKTLYEQRATQNADELLPLYRSKDFQDLYSEYGTVLTERDEIRNELLKMMRREHKEDFVAPDAFARLRDAILMDKVLIRYVYEPDAHKSYLGSEQNRVIMQRRMDGLREWIRTGCSDNTYYCNKMSRYFITGSGEFAVPREEMERIMWEVDLTPLDELAVHALYDNTAAFTRVFYDRSGIDTDLLKERDRLVDMALSVALRMLFVALLVSLFFVRTIKEIIFGAEQIGAGNLDVKFRYRGSDELGTLVQSLNHMTNGLRHREKMIEELSAAEQIQKQLLPESMPSSLEGDLSFGNLYRPSSGVGGDYYDYIEIRPGVMGFCIADVTGHGPGPAMVMAMMRSHLHSLINEGISDPKDIMLKINARVYKETPPATFITMLFGIYDQSTKELRYCSAGHNKSLLYRYKDERVEELEGGGLPVGMEENEIFGDLLRLHRVLLGKGDLFIQYTDGLNEAMNDQKEQFGKGHIINIIQEMGKTKSSAIVKKLAVEVENFTGKRVISGTEGGPTELEDDIAIIAFRRLR